jgi:mannose-6-phosphate isomerase-like protein (cupin superfamily)
MKLGKVWGTTEPLLITPTVEIHRIVIEPDGYCSMHQHHFKHNCFIVTEGYLHIEVQKNDYDLLDVTDLMPGEMTTVAPREYHRFVAGPNGAEAYEIYYPEPLGADIERKDHGGVLDDEKDVEFGPDTVRQFYTDGSTHEVWTPTKERERKPFVDPIRTGDDYDHG